ncbi:hypothetical protein [Portibacter marinus]|uniref:hypothetical protein n=1 Tax=Portibacter marinus TaxID=2898660 RepID=UPI001F1CE2E2|nr:hypothetical protein [Portibacter marinus]
MDKVDRIQAYLDDELSESDKVKFQNDMKKDAILKDQYQKALLAQKISKGLLEMEMREVLEQQKGGMSRQWIWLGIAAFLLIFLGTILVWSMIDETPSIYAMEYREPMWPGTRGGANELASILSEFRKGGDIQDHKLDIENIADLPENEKDLWIAEMFLKRGVYDSVSLYLPEFPSDHIKSDRVRWIEDFLEQQKN